MAVGSDAAFGSGGYSAGLPNSGGGGGGGDAYSNGHGTATGGNGGIGG